MIKTNKIGQAYFVVMLEFSAKYVDDYGGDWQDRSDQLEKLVGKKCGASGMGFGIRDMSFEYDSFTKATEAFTKLEKINWITKLQIKRYNI